MRSRAVVGVAALSGALVCGGWLLQRGLAHEGGVYGRARLFDEVMAHVASEYVDTLTQAQLYRMAVDGMLDELHDPYSVFLSPDRLRRLDESTTGNYGGLGIQIDVRERWITVVAPLPGTPAERAGMQTGDRIVRIDGRSTDGLAPEEALRALRGERGTRVQLTVERPGVTEPIVFSVTRAEIHNPAVRRVTMLRDGIGYLGLATFSESTAVELRAAVNDLRRRGMRTLVLDVRGNPGGLLTQGVDATDLFLDRGQRIVTMRGRAAGANRHFDDTSAQEWAELPIIVLTDGGSASASEILAGALQDHDRAVIIGGTTFGKGSAQTVYKLPNGGALKLTTARWFTPAGRSIQKAHRDHPDSAAEGDAGDAPEDSLGERPLSQRETFRTDAGRTVYGGGGITPDLIVAAAQADTAALRFQQALGRELPRFRDALTEYAISLRAERAVRSLDFQVTPAMREELWRRLQLMGVALPRASYDAADSLVARLLEVEIARFVFGADAEFRRRVAYDRTIGTALDVAAGAATQRELLARASQRRAANREDLPRTP